MGLMGGDGWRDLVWRLCRTSSCCLCNEEFGYCATVSPFLFQDIGEAVLSGLVLEKPCIEVGSGLKESFHK